MGKHTKKVRRRRGRRRGGSVSAWRDSSYVAEATGRGTSAALMRQRAPASRLLAPRAALLSAAHARASPQGAAPRAPCTANRGGQQIWRGRTRATHAAVLRGGPARGESFTRAACSGSRVARASASRGRRACGVCGAQATPLADARRFRGQCCSVGGRCRPRRALCRGDGGACGGRTRGRGRRRRRIVDMCVRGRFTSPVSTVCAMVLR